MAGSASPVVVSSGELARKLNVFQVTAADIGVLSQYRPWIERHLPTLLLQLDEVSTAGREVALGLTDPKLRSLRDDYWLRLTSGRLDDAFAMAARRFAQESYAKGIPSGAVTIRHSCGARLIMDGLFDRAGTVWPGLRWKPAGFGNRRRASVERVLNKVLWLGLSLMLEEFAREEAARTRTTIAMVEESFSAKMTDLAGLLRSQACGLETAVTSISNSASRSSKSSELVAHDALEASTAVRMIAEASNELAGSIRQIGTKIAHCADTARIAAERARLGDHIVQDFIKGAGAINEVVGLISQIAHQIKLLAFNAAIEAGRAGDAGLGFAVVAAEVQHLARKTTVATERIAQQISFIQSSTGRTAATIQALADGIEDVNEITAVIAVSIQAQEAATTAIAASVARAALGNEHVSGLTETIKLESDESFRLADQLTSAAAGIGLQSDTIGQITRDFMVKVREAQS